MNIIKFNACDFHPELRPIMENELNRINLQYPAFGNAHVEIVVSNFVPEEITRCDCSNPKCENKKPRPVPIESYAMTATEPRKNKHVIIFKEDWFGVKGNPQLLRDAINNDKEHKFHGDMVDPAFILAHEYGHVFDNMILHKYGRTDDDEADTPIRTTYDQLYSAASDAVFGRENPVLVLLDMILATEAPQERDYDESDPQRLVSRYAYTDPKEFFAETFAAICFGSDEQKKLPTAVMMKNLITLVYEDCCGKAH